MFSRSSDHIGVAAIDGSIALGLTMAAITYSHHLFTGLPQLAAYRVSFPDAAFGVMFIILWQYCFSVLNLYDRFAPVSSRMSAVFRGVLTMLVPVTLHLYIFHRPYLNTRTMIYMFACLFAYELDRIGLRDFVSDRLAARNRQNILFVGSGPRAGKAWREIRTRHHAATHVFGFVDDRDPAEMAPDIAHRYLGRLDDLSDLLLTLEVDIILIAMPIQSSYHLMQRAVTIAESVGIRVVYLNDIYATKQHPIVPNRQLFQELFPVQENRMLRLAAKRLVDLVVSSLLLVLLIPVWIVVAIAVRMTSEGPAFFCQERVGYKRRRFQMIKFRSMVKDAEARLTALEQHNEASGPIFKMKRDPRVTPIGRFLRSTSIDELPQLWNVFKGEMSLVGPRPMSVRDVSLFDKSTLMRRFSVKPGITGLWQVQGRSSVGFDEWIKLDTRYIEQWSLLLDFRILVQTLTAVVKRSGAV